MLLHAVAVEFILHKSYNNGMHDQRGQGCQNAQDQIIIKVSKGAKIRNRYNQVPHLIQDTNWKETNSELYTTNESQEVSPFPTGHK